MKAKILCECVRNQYLKINKTFYFLKYTKSFFTIYITLCKLLFWIYTIFRKP